MWKDKSILAVIPARGGSKGLQSKNIVPLGGEPLISYSIKSALECALIDRVLVSTEDETIKQVSLEYGAEVMDRPQSLATDTATTQSVIEDLFLSLPELENYDEFALLQATSPLRTAAHLEQCIKEFAVSDAKSAVSVSVCKPHPANSYSMKEGFLYPLYEKEFLHLPRQELPNVYLPNGLLYYMQVKTFMEYKTFSVPPILPIQVDQESLIDIDTELDIFIAEQILNRRRQLHSNQE